MTSKSFVVFLLASIMFGGCMYLCVKPDIDKSITAFDKSRMEARKNMVLDYQAYTEPKNDKINIDIPKKVE